MRTHWILATCAILFAAPAFAQESTQEDVQSLRSEIDALRATQAAMRQDLQDLKALLLRGQADTLGASNRPAGDVELSLDGAVFKGSAQAPLVLVEFSDFRCPFCNRYATTTYPRILREYVDTGHLRYAFVHFPIESLHPDSFRAHLAAACAADQGRFWEMHDRLFAQSQSTDVAALTVVATAVGADPAAFRRCVESQTHAAAIREGIKLGSGAGVVGTPTFLLGTVGAGNSFKAVKMIAGAKPYEVFAQAIEERLAAAQPSKGAAPATLAVLPPGAGTRASIP
jgi:protein-disulfide isomerase